LHSDVRWRVQPHAAPPASVVSSKLMNQLPLLSNAEHSVAIWRQERGRSRASPMPSPTRRALPLRFPSDVSVRQLRDLVDRLDVDDGTVEGLTDLACPAGDAACLLR
jgi:hypothetical protein